jgi:guanosine-3',5'-bis(diphosphate) 3'-pyrophosphohydrolase
MTDSFALKTRRYIYRGSGTKSIPEAIAFPPFLDYLEKERFQAMEIDTLIRNIRTYRPQHDTDFLRRAYLLAEKVCKDLDTGAGWARFRHSLLTAGVLAELRIDPATIAAALLQGIQAHGGVTRKTLAEAFGEETAALVDGISKLGQITWESLEEKKAEGLRKMFLAMADDLRVVLVSLSGQIVKMRRLGEFEDARRPTIVHESMSVFAPLANRLGIWSIKRELEDLALLNSDPDGYNDIARLLEASQESREKDIG